MSSVDELERLVDRVAPALGGRVDLAVGGEGFSYECDGRRLRLSGEDVVAAAAGLHHFSFHHAAERFTWTTPRLDLPQDLPRVEKTSRRTELVQRYYLNFVTYGYSSAFWDWERWEAEIDWMALHSVNRPLMTIGHEAILVELYRSAGLSEDEALTWLGSPAHFPWMFMGGLNSWGGPVSREYLEGRLDLATKVLGRMRALGMRPVLPGFAGQVPPPLADEAATFVDWQGWRTPYLDPTSSTYRDLAASFYRLQRERLGTDHLYAIDPFIESIPARDEIDWLEDCGRAIHGALSSADPEAVWVLQAWPFHYHRQYWGDGRAEAFISAVPENGLLLLDLWAEFAPLWQKSDAMFGRPWLWCAVHNFGGRFALFGDLDGVVDGVAGARRSPAKGQLEGVGLAMEAIENNEVFYELLTDQVWGPTELEDWIERWALSRYASTDPRAREVWHLLSTTLYGPGRARSTPSPLIARPWNDVAPYASQRLAGEALEPASAVISANIDAENDPAVFESLHSVARACEVLLSLDKCPTRDRDLTDLLLHVLAQHARYPIREILRRYREGAPGIDSAFADLAEHLEWADRVASTDASCLLGTWLQAARRAATSEGEADRFEYDARSLVTVWGTQSSGLHDYSGRHWAGLLTDFYLPRWRIWAEWLQSGASDLDAFRRRIVDHEEGWRTDRTNYPTTTTDTIDNVARAALGWLAQHPDNPLTPPN